MQPELKARVLALLVQIEWNGEYSQYCPDCMNLMPADDQARPGDNHQPDCELAALIRELEKPSA